MDQTQKPATDSNTNNSSGDSVKTDAAVSDKVVDAPVRTGESSVKLAVLNGTSLGEVPVVSEYQQEAARKVDAAAKAAETAAESVVAADVKKEVPPSNSEKSLSVLPSTVASEDNIAVLEATGQKDVALSEAAENNEHVTVSEATVSNKVVTVSEATENNKDVTVSEATIENSDIPSVPSPVRADHRGDGDVTEIKVDEMSETNNGNNVMTATEVISECISKADGVEVTPQSSSVSLDLPKSLGSESEEYVTPREETFVTPREEIEEPGEEGSGTMHEDGGRVVSSGNETEGGTESHMDAAIVKVGDVLVSVNKVMPSDVEADPSGAPSQVTSAHTLELSSQQAAELECESTATEPSLERPDEGSLQSYVEGIVESSISEVREVIQEAAVRSGMTQQVIVEDTVVSAVPSDVKEEIVAESSPEKPCMVHFFRQQGKLELGTETSELNPDAPEFQSHTSPSRENQVTPGSYQPPEPCEETPVELTNGHCDPTALLNGHSEPPVSNLHATAALEEAASDSDCDAVITDGGPALSSSPKHKLPNVTVAKQAVQAAACPTVDVTPTSLVQSTVQECSASANISSDTTSSISDIDAPHPSSEDTTAELPDKPSGHTKYGPLRSKRLAAKTDQLPPAVPGPAEPVVPSDQSAPVPQLAGLQTNTSSRDSSPHRAVGRSRGRGTEDKHAREVKPGVDGAMKSHARPLTEGAMSKSVPPATDSALPAVVISGQITNEAPTIPAQPQKPDHAVPLSQPAVDESSGLPIMPSKPGESMKVSQG